MLDSEIKVFRISITEKKVMVLSLRAFLIEVVVKVRTGLRQCMRASRLSVFLE